MNIADALARYDRLGFSVIPIRYGDKRPALSTWAPYQRRRATSEELATWFARRRNVGIVCGDVSGLVVVDCDTPAIYEQVVALEPALKAAMTVRTGRGVHIYLRPEAPGTRTSAFVVDGVTNHIKAAGGYVVAPPSLHASGSLYELTNDADPLPYDIARLAARLGAIASTAAPGTPRTVNRIPMMSTPSRMAARVAAFNR